MTHIGIVEYINALPLRLGAPKSANTFTYAIPSVLNRMLRQGELDMALTSCAEYFDGPYDLMPGYCIGAQKEILSVNLYSRVPSLDGARIGLTHHSATSIALLKVLCHHFWKVEPTFVPLQQGEEYDASLIIGDDALKQMTIPGYQTIDMATAWYEATGLPFVFAVFAVREGVQADPAPFEAALQWSEAHPEELIEAAHAQSGLPKPLIKRYYEVCHYRLGEQELKGLELFKKLRQSVSEICA